ncbi:Phage domain protein (modular protein) [Xenorhabdus nematophila str. Anatoliense]|nr:Phage domain protein (modular protein) [Xenorhabdus nematophila str. Anatoliense]
MKMVSAETAVQALLLSGGDMKIEKRWARLEDDIVMELTDIDPTGRFHPLLIWVGCPAETRTGCRYENGKFIQPDNIQWPEQPK